MALELHGGTAFQDDDQLVFFLVVPETGRGSMTLGNDPLDPNTIGLEDRREKFFGKVGGQVVEKVSGVHSTIPISIPVAAAYRCKSPAARSKVKSITSAPRKEITTIFILAVSSRTIVRSESLVVLPKGPT